MFIQFIDVVIDGSQASPVPESESSYIMSFQIAVMRSPKWLYPIYPEGLYKNDEAAIFECDILCDLDEMPSPQKEKIDQDRLKIDNTIIATMPLHAVERYPYVFASLYYQTWIAKL